MRLPLFALLLLPLSASAKDIRLDAPGGPMEKMEIVDQGRVGNCWAWAAYQMIDAYRFSHGTPPEEAIAPMTVLYSSGGDLHDTGGWMTGPSISSTRALKKVCTQREITRIVGNYGEKSFVGQVDGAFYHSDKFWENNRVGPPPAVEEFTQELIHRFNTAPERADAVRDALTLAFVRPHSSMVTEGDHFVREILPALCAGDLADISNVPNADVSEEFLRDNEKVWTGPAAERAKYVATRISALLDRPNPQPVDIGICGNVLQNDLNYRMDPKNMHSCLGHSTLVIGKRSGKNGLEFLIRNSWGKSWCPPSAKFECSGGQAWLPASIIAPNVSSIVVMPND